MSVRFRVLTEADVKAVLTMDELIDAMASALKSFSAREVEQPVRSIISVDGNRAFFGNRSPQSSPGRPLHYGSANGGGVRRIVAPARA